MQDWGFDMPDRAWVHEDRVIVSPAEFMGLIDPYEERKKSRKDQACSTSILHEVEEIIKARKIHGHVTGGYPKPLIDPKIWDWAPFGHTLTLYEGKQPDPDDPNDRSKDERRIWSVVLLTDESLDEILAALDFDIPERMKQDEVHETILEKLKQNNACLIEYIPLDPHSTSHVTKIINLQVTEGFVKNDTSLLKNHFQNTLGQCFGRGPENSFYYVVLSVF